MRITGNLGCSWYRARLKKLVRVYGIGYSPRAGCAARVDDAQDEEQQVAAGEPARAQVLPLFLHDGTSGGNESGMMACGRFYA